MSAQLPENPTTEQIEAYEAALPRELSPDMVQFIEEFTAARETMGGKRMSGRVLGLLIITDEPFMSAQRIGTLLNASAGAVSMATSSLARVGFITRHHIPGVRRRFYQAPDDVWGTFLGGEREYLRRMSAVLESAMQTEPGSKPGPATRLHNGQRYMNWIEQHHRELMRAWHEYRDREDEPPESPPPVSAPPEEKDT